MCRAIPSEVLQVAGDHAEVMVDGRPVWVSAVGLPELTAGEYVLVYAGVAIERVSAEEARDLLDFLHSLDELFEDEGEPASLLDQAGS